MRILLAMLLLLPGCLRAESSALLDQVAAQLNSADIVAGEFEQAQRIAVLSRPLVSHGRFVFSRDAGLLWEVLEPVQSSLVFGADGEVRTSSAIAGARALGFVARLLNSVLGGELATLDDSFQVEGQVEAEGWSLQLNPRGGPLARFIDRIDLQGAATIEQVQLLDANGDQSTLTFRRVVFPAELPSHASILRSPERLNAESPSD